MKTCSKCGIEQNFCNFNKRKSSTDGYNSQCKNCANSYKRTGKYRGKYCEYDKTYYYNNREERLSNNKNYRLSNKKKENKRKNDYVKTRMLTDPEYRLKLRCRKLISQAFRVKNYTKSVSSTKILGCTINEFKTHLERQFKDWMNWGNYGKYNGTEGYGWDIDHIIPLDSAKTEDDIIKLNHYTNLQPLCSYINRNVKRATV